MTVTKWNVGGYLVPVTMTEVGKRIELVYPFNKTLTAEIKMMDGAKWHGFDEKPRKIWSITNTLRNKFQIDYLSGKNVYERYDSSLLELTPNRSLYKHQLEMYRHSLTRRRSILACEMGTGKSLVAIEVMEYLATQGVSELEMWFVGPKSAVKAFKLELAKWKCKLKPILMTYNAMMSSVKDWQPGRKAPKLVVFDEASKIKTMTAQRTQAAMHLANAVNSEHDGYVMLMSGTPAPKSPVDWYSLTETACPGFLKEGNVAKFKASLCLIEQREGLDGATYPHLVTWLDDDRKCAECGEMEHHGNHVSTISTKDTIHALTSFKFGTTDTTQEAKSSEIKASSSAIHTYKKSVNQVARLFKRLQGLVLVKHKRDCLDLPEKVYEVSQLMPTIEMIRSAKIIKNTTPRAIQALTLLRELSDGFLYKERKCGERECTRCMGCGTVLGASEAPINQETGTVTSQAELPQARVECPVCQGSLKEPIYERYCEEIGTPKDDELIDDLESCEEAGRIIIWGGFEGTINRIVKICHKQGWATLKADGKGWVGTNYDGNALDGDELLISLDIGHPRYKELHEKYPQVAFVSNAGTGGMAVTLTAAHLSVFYSNSFNGEDRWQAEDRFHRPGADKIRGCTIKDYYCLPSDKLVHNNLKVKRNLQDITLGELNDSMERET